jgi:hypothetical protein
MDNQLRSSQLITTYSPGAMVELTDSSIIVSGLDGWKYPMDQPCLVSEPRLAAKITKVLRPHSPRRNAILLKSPPPPADEHRGQESAFVKGWKFPLWFISQDVQVTPEKFRRRRLVHRDALDGGKFERKSVVSVRFVRACRRGHCGDIQWHSFAHRDDGTCPGELWVEERGTSGDLSDVWIVCSICSAARCMREAAQREGEPLKRCNGSRPWLNDIDPAGCKEVNRLLVRNASNSSFPRVMSVISIPDRAAWLTGRVMEHWESEAFGDLESESDLRALLRRPALKQAFEGFDETEIFSNIEAVRSGAKVAGSERPIKEVEFDALSRADLEGTGDEPGGDFFVRKLDQKTWHSAEFDCIEKIVLVHRLREVTALIGFTRFEPLSTDIAGDVLKLDVKTAHLVNGEPDWVPCVENRGEGLFIQFRADVLGEWMNRGDVLKRQQALEEGFKKWKEDHPDAEVIFPGVGFYLLHSISHLLIQTIALECGYPASSLRERIYVPAPDGSAMKGSYGILIFTGSTDSHGTLGGLVESARDIRKHLKRAFAASKLCSNDPICSAHYPGTHSQNHLSGAACHACMFLSETSCEQFNQYLDRALVVPTIDALGCELFNESV